MGPKFEIGAAVRDSAQRLVWTIEDRIVDGEHVRYLCSRAKRAVLKVYLEPDLAPARLARAA